MQPQEEQPTFPHDQLDDTQGQQPGSDSNEVVEAIQQEVQSARRPRYQILRQARVLLPIYILLLTLFAALAVWVHSHPILAIDVTITRDFQADRSPWLSTLMTAVSYLGNTALVFAALVWLTAAIFWVLRLRLEALIIVCVSTTSELLDVLLKLLVARPRPSEPLVNILQHANGLSFPSGHVMAYVAYWGLLFSFGILLFNQQRWWRTALLIVAGLFVILVGPSRIYLGDHWASDVLGAYVIGGLWLWLWLWIYTKLKERGVLAIRARPA
ncbi:MAG: phosphatase PAP2 family protein [Ktedonobacteraceae bacterium]